MAGLTDDREKRLKELKKEVTQRGFDRHASRLRSVSELPVELQASAVADQAERESIQTIIMFPQQIQRGWHYVPKQALLFTVTGLIHVIASIWPGQEPRMTCLKRGDLIYTQVTLVLLYGCLEIVAQGEETPSRISMEFSTVDWYCLSPPLKQFLQASQVQTGKGSFTSQRSFDELPLKFSNGLKIYGLLPGEELEELAFQAGTWTRWLYFFRRPASANTLLLLTSHYMVVIQEEMNVKQGWIITYLPRNGIAGIRSQPSGLWNELSVHLERGDQATDYKLMLKRDVAETWRRGWAQHGGQWQERPGESV